MTILHKLSPERVAGEVRPVDVRLSLQHDVGDVADAVLAARMVQALESAATRYPIHRHVRCAVRRPSEDVFDDLALNTGLAAQRLAQASLLLDGPGVFVRAEAWRKTDYCACIFNLWAESKARAEEVRATLLRVAGDRLLPEEMFILDWHFTNGAGVLNSAACEERAQEALSDEAYPTLGMPVAEFIRAFLAARETVLVLQGPPGTGKTRLVSAILAAMSRKKGASAKIMYTSDTRSLENDEIFVDFITGTHDAFVIEDADHLLRARTDGNHDLHRFLAVADGVARAQGRKILFTTNLPNIRDMDEALLRPGRCFGVVTTRALHIPEAEKLAQVLAAGDANVAASIRARLAAAGNRSVSLAELYRLHAEISQSPA